MPFSFCYIMLYIYLLILFWQDWFAFLGNGSDFNFTLAGEAVFPNSGAQQLTTTMDSAKSVYLTCICLLLLLLLLLWFCRLLSALYQSLVKLWFTSTA